MLLPPPNFKSDSIMGNGQGKSLPCFHGSSHPKAAAIVTSEPPLDMGHGHSFVYLGPPPPHLACSGSGGYSSSRVHHSEDAASSAFLSISGAAVSANAATPLSTAPFVLRNDLACSSAASFESSSSFAASPLQPRHSASLSGSDRHYFNSGPLDRAGFHSGPLDQHRPSSASASTTAPFQSLLELRRAAARRRRTTPTLIRRASRAISFAAARLGCIVAPTELADKPIGDKVPNFIANLDLPGDPSSNSTTITSSGNDQSSLDCPGDESDSPDVASGNIHWAQGKAGEDRIHVVVSEEHGWVYVGIYDGFNGPDATDYLLANLYPTVHAELKGLLWHDDGGGDKCTMESETGSWEMNKRLKEQLTQASSGAAVDHRAVLRALSRALRKTEEGFLRMTDVMIAANPELAMMGSCVLAVLMRGEDVYLVNVGDSRAVLARRAESCMWNLVGQATQDLDSIKDETLRYLQLCDMNELVALQLTSDHTACNDEEARRIRSEHPDDSLVIVNSRVKGSLKLTRAFGAGYLKQPKWNNALLGAFRVDYRGISPYITCNPSICYHRIGPKDKYLILSSDGLYQYFTNEEVVTQVKVFIATNPEGDPAQYLVQEVLYRAADKAGMDFNQLLQVPQGDRRRYHDDVSIIIISLEGRMWRSCV